MLDDASVAELVALVNALPFRRLSDEPVVASDDELLEIEAMVGAPLPQDYRWYLQSVGKVFVGDGYCVHPEGEDRLSISVIYGGRDPSEDPDSQSIEWNSRTFSDLLGPSEIVIAQDLFGDMFTLSVTTERFRHIAHDADRSIDLGVTGFRSFLQLLQP